MMPPRSARERFLALAVEMTEHEGLDTSDLLTAGLTPAAIADAAGISRTQLYRWWPTKADLWVDVVAFVAASDLGPSLDRISFDLGPDGRGVGITDVARAHLNRLQHDLARDPWVPLRTGLVATPPDTRLDAIVSNSIERAIAATSNQVETMLAFMGRTVGGAMTPYDLAVTIYCLADGISVAAQLDETLVSARPSVGTEEWSLLAYGVAATLLGCSRPSDTDRVRRPDAAPLPPRVAVDYDEPRRVAALDAGARLYLARRGEQTLFRNLTIDRLARRARVTPQAIRRHWNTQLDLALDVQSQLYRRDAELLVHAFGRALGAARRGRSDRLDAGLRSLWRSFTSPDRWLDRWIFAGHHHPAAAPSGVNAIHQAIRFIIKDAQAEAANLAGQAKTDDVATITLITLLTLSGAGRLIRADPNLVGGTDHAERRILAVLERQLTRGVATMRQLRHQSAR